MAGFESSGRLLLPSGSSIALPRYKQILDRGDLLGAYHAGGDSHIDSQESDFGGHFGSQAVKAKNQPRVARPSKIEALVRTGGNCQGLFWSG